MKTLKNFGLTLIETLILIALLITLTAIGNLVYKAASKSNIVISDK